jgi:hypothetical protein
MLSKQLRFAVKYDRDTLGTVANRLFVRRWAPLFPFLYLAILICGAGAGVASFTLLKDPFSGTILLALVAWAALVWLILWFRMRHLIGKLAGREIEFSLEEDQLTVKIGGEYQILEWKELLEFERYPAFVLLYVTRATAVVIPTSVLSSEADELIARKVRLA